MNSPNINVVILKPKVILWRLALSKLSATTSSNSQAFFKSQPQRKPHTHLTSSTPFPRLLATADPLCLYEFT